MTSTGKLKLLKNNALNTFSTVAIGGVSSPLDSLWMPKIHSCERTLEFNINEASKLFK